MPSYRPHPQFADKCLRLRQRLADTIPANRLITDPMQTIALGTDAGLYRMVPGLVVRVDNEAELQTVMAGCHDLDLPFTFRGSGTSVSGQAVSHSVLIQLTRSWTRCEIADQGRRVTTDVGNTGGKINRLLAPHGRKLGPDPASLKVATIGGMVANNSSGMGCGVAHNSQNTLTAMSLILADGTRLDTADPHSRAAFAQARPDIVEGLAALAKKIQDSPELAQRIRKKYAIKNTIGFSVNALVDYTDPVDMLFHLMVGSEGCLGFISQVTFATVADPAAKATAMLVFDTMDQACAAMLKLRDCPVAAAELMDRGTIKAVEDLPEIPDMMTGLGPHAAAILIETRAHDPKELDAQVADILAALEGSTMVAPPEFVFDPGACRRLWEIRDGFDPIICAKAPPGTIMISEDVALAMEDLAPAIADFHALFERHGYDDAVIFGHALAGNLHFVLLQDFNDPKEVVRYEAFIENLVDVVVNKYDGSLKAEHGTGRNMAPFVEAEWGSEIYHIMEEIKALLDPKGLLNPGVILTDNPKAHITDLKTFPTVDPLVDKCIECGFCEGHCVANGLTLSARQRIVTLRTLTALEQAGRQGDPGLLAQLQKTFDYQVLDTCAADGLCALACPSGINTGTMVKSLRRERAGHTARTAGNLIGNHMAPVTTLGRLGLKVASTAQTLLGDSFTVSASQTLNQLTQGTTPRLFSHMPLAQKPLGKQKAQRETSRQAVVYFPSCVNRTLGADRKTPKDEAIFTLVKTLCDRANLDIIIPEETEKLCCGLSFASKGLEDAAQKREQSLNRALMAASKNGKYPVLCDMSPCLLHMKETLSPALTLLEPVAFALDYLIPRLTLTKVPGPVVVHPVCSLKKMGLEAKLMELARHCAEQVTTTQTNCCGFAGDKGFNTPELNHHGLADLKDQIPPGATTGYSTSRTCEIGLAEEAEIPFKSILYLVDQASSPGKN